MRSTYIFLGLLTILSSFVGCSDPCDVPRIEIQVEVDYVYGLEDLLDRFCKSSVDNWGQAIQDSKGKWPNEVAADFVAQFEELDRGNQAVILGCFPQSNAKDLIELTEYLTEEFEILRDRSQTVLRRRFEAFEDICASIAPQKDAPAYKVGFAHAYDSIATELVTIPGRFQVYETVPYSELGNFLSLCDTVMAQDSMEGSFVGLFNPDVMPNPRSPVVGESTVEDSARINRILEHRLVANSELTGIKMMWTKADARVGGDKKDAGLQLVATKYTQRDDMGDYIMDAFVGGEDDRPAVRISLNAMGARILRQLSEENNGRSLAMVVDGVIWQLAKVNEPLIQGRFELSGGLSKPQSEILAAVLKSGKLSAPLRIVE